MRWEKVKVSESRTLARKRRVREGAWSGKSQFHTVGRRNRRRREKTGKEILLRRKRRKHEGISGRKNSPGGSGESWFHSKSGQT